MQIELCPLVLQTLQALCTTHRVSHKPARCLWAPKPAQPHSFHASHVPPLGACRGLYLISERPEPGFAGGASRGRDHPWVLSVVFVGCSIRRRHAFACIRRASPATQCPLDLVVLSQAVPLPLLNSRPDARSVLSLHCSSAPSLPCLPQTEAFSDQGSAWLTAVCPAPGTHLAHSRSLNQ